MVGLLAHNKLIPFQFEFCKILLHIPVKINKMSHLIYIYIENSIIHLSSVIYNSLIKELVQAERDTDHAPIFLFCLLGVYRMCLCTGMCSCIIYACHRVLSVESMRGTTLALFPGSLGLIFHCADGRWSTAAVSQAL